MQIGPWDYYEGLRRRASERQSINELLYEIRRRRREREAADRERRRLERIALDEFIRSSRQARRVRESQDRFRRYTRALVTGLEESIGAGRYIL